jgi:hypothetical protein
MRDKIEYGLRKSFPDLWEKISDETNWSVLMCTVRVQRHWRETLARRAAAAQAAVGPCRHCVLRHKPPTK